KYTQRQTLASVKVAREGIPVFFMVKAESKAGI
ncbi:hypothetical protein CMV_003473, partial [Castanea mollissima]